jgi:hypothetical protein
VCWSRYHESRRVAGRLRWWTDVETPTMALEREPLTLLTESKTAAHGQIWDLGRMPCARSARRLWACPISSQALLDEYLGRC